MAAVILTAARVTVFVTAREGRLVERMQGLQPQRPGLPTSHLQGMLQNFGASIDSS